MIILRTWELEHDQVAFLLLQGTMNHPKVTAVIGSGASAVTTLRALKNLASEPQKGVGVVWITRHGPEPYQLIDNDPLPQRRALYRLDENLNLGSFNQIHTLQTYFFLSAWETNYPLARIPLTSYLSHTMETVKF